MKRTVLTLAAASISAPALAHDKREMDAHVHGVTVAEIAVEHGVIEISLLSPGMDIVGFEYEATSAEDKDAVETAIRHFLVPEDIVILPEAAGCRLTEVRAHLNSNDHDHDHDHGEEHADHIHEKPADGAGHSEFRISYAYACDDEEALTSIGFPFFERFENAQEIDARYVTETRAGSAELSRDAFVLKLE